MSNLHVIDHPLITHKLSIMRNRKTGSKDFRELLNEIAMLMGYEVFRDLPLEDALRRVEAGEPYVIRQKIPPDGHHHLPRRHLR